LTDPHAGARLWNALSASVADAVVGADRPLRLMAIALLAEGHALLEDVPGVGKTLLAHAFARSLGLGFGRIQGTPDLLPSDVTGSSVLADGAFRFIPGPIFTNVLLVDEINRATPRTQSALLEAMQERQVSVDGETRAIPSPFLVLATQNPIELEGTFALPEAQLDRFLVRIGLGYPAEEDERAIARRYRAAAEPLDALEPVIGPEALFGMREAIRAITVSGEVESYLVRLVRATRDHPDLHLGASPRASVALYRASQAAAFLDGRDFVLPDDIAALAGPVLTHRLIVDVDRELRGATAAGALGEIVDRVPVGVGAAAG
jgi:MoxR-like ATPase